LERVAFATLKNAKRAQDKAWSGSFRDPKHAKRIEDKAWSERQCFERVLFVYGSGECQAVQRQSLDRVVFVTLIESQAVPRTQLGASHKTWSWLFDDSEEG
jgi:hypothetical protein